MQIHERPIEGILFCTKPSKNSIVQIDGRDIVICNFCNIGCSSGSNKPPVRLGGTCHQAEDGDSDADEWQERRESTRVRNLTSKVVKSPPDKECNIHSTDARQPGGLVPGGAYRSELMG